MRSVVAGVWEDGGDAWPEHASMQARAEEGDAQSLGSHLVAVGVRQAGDEAVQA